MLGLVSCSELCVDVFSWRLGACSRGEDDDPDLVERNTDAWAIM